MYFVRSFLLKGKDWRVVPLLLAALFVVGLFYSQARQQSSLATPQAVEIWSYICEVAALHDLPPEFVYAIATAESHLIAHAQSESARGLMQLMPATASRVAKKIRLRYFPKKLTEDKAYNLQIGQAYVANLLLEFDNSYILTLAAYNAGPGRVRRWIRANGDPRDPMVDPIDWIELIPFDETRNYVQRVIENLHVYRHRMAEREIAFTPESDLRR